MRIGQGFDVHVLTEGRDLYLGGIKIPYSKGLLGHSDADVLLHAIADALLGAIGAGDIGELFPNTDPKYAGIDSRKLLGKCYELVLAKSYKISNVDCTVMAEKPNLSLYKKAIQAEIAKILKLELNCVNIKATTAERLGAIGREEGIAAMAIVLLN